MVWKPTVLAPVTRVLDYRSEWMQCSAGAEFSNKIKTESMDLDNHLLASTLCGLICDIKGASNFINDKPDPSQVTLTCNWTQKLWVERHKDLQNVVNQNIAHCHTVNTKTKSKATHVVVSVLYGVQIFCVFAHDVKGKEEDEQVRKVTQEKLSKIMKKFQVAFDNQLNAEKFKQEFSQEEKHELADLKCRLYMDLKTESVNQCNLFDAYESCINLKRQIYRDGTIDISKLKGVPIAIQLCPLEVLLSPSTTGVLKKFGEFRDVTYGLVNRYCRILVNLRRTVIKAEKMYTNDEETYPAVCEFVNLVSKYQHFLQESWKKAVVLARSTDPDSDEDSAVRSIVNKAEKHPLFKISQVKQWINSKEAEVDMMDLIAYKVGTRAVVLADASQLAKHVNNKCSLVLTVPPLDERTNAILVAMKECCAENFHQEQVANVGKSWRLIQSKKKLVLTYLRELDTHLQRNQQEPSNNFIVTFGESNKHFGCSYSVYENGKLLKNNLLRLPSPPSGLQILHPVAQKAKKAKTTFSSITAKWNYEDLGFPCNFTVQSRQKGSSDPWVSCKTSRPGQTQLSIDCPTGRQMEFRVAADTLVGRSDYSAVIDTSVSDADLPQILENNRVVLQPPTYLKVKSFTGFYFKIISVIFVKLPIFLKVKSMTGTTVELKWKPPSGDNRGLRYRINCWKKDVEPLSADEHVTEYDWTSYRLEDLQPDTTYCANIMSSSICEWTDSNPSQIIEFTTGKNIRIAERIVRRTERIRVENGLNFYQIPLSKVAWRCKTAERFAFEAKGEINKSMGDLHFTILLMGSSDSGKESLINNFINYVFNVDLTQPFRLQLMDPSREENSVRVYDIHHSKVFRINYSLTIIDTPNFDEEDPAKNKEIAKTIRSFLNDENGIQQVNMVGLVLDASASYLESINLYIYSLLISLFGEEIKTNINFLLTSAEKEDEWLWNDVVEAELVKQNQNYHKFDSSLVSCYVKNFENFFCSLPKSVKSTVFSKRMVDKKKRMEVTVEQLRDRVTIAVTKLKGLQKTKERLANHSTEIEVEKNVEFQLAVNVVNKVALPFGEVVTNCAECKMTCHPDCGLTGGLFDCHAMDHSMEENVRTCRVCPKKCLWNVHASEPFKWINKEEYQTVSLNTMKRKYETDLRIQNLTLQEFAERLGADVEATKREIVDLIQIILDFLKQVNAIAKQENPYSLPQCVSVTDSILDVLVYLKREEVERQDGNIQWKNEWMELYGKAESFLSLPKFSSDSDSSEYYDSDSAVSDSDYGYFQ